MAITRSTVHACPRCGLAVKGLGAIRDYFGTRCEGRTPIPQSYCKDCRKEHAKLMKAKPLRERYIKKTGDTRKRSVQHMKKALGE